VNTYFRAVLAEQVNRADFEPREYAQLAKYQAPTAPKCTQHPLTTEQTNFENIPASVLEHVLQHTNLFTVCSAALASRSLCKVKLITSFESRWHAAVTDISCVLYRLQNQTQFGRLCTTKGGDALSHVSNPLPVILPQISKLSNQNGVTSTTKDIWLSSACNVQVVSSPKSSQ